MSSAQGVIFVVVFWKLSGSSSMIRYVAAIRPKPTQ